MKKQEIKVDVGEIKYDATFEDLIEVITNIRKRVRKGEINSPEFHADMDFDSYDGLIFKAQRLETDEEFEKRLQEYKKWQEKKHLAELSKEERKLQKERNEYERLKKKFEGETYKRSSNL